MAMAMTALRTNMPRLGDLDMPFAPTGAGADAGASGVGIACGALHQSQPLAGPSRLRIVRDPSIRIRQAVRGEWQRARRPLSSSSASREYSTGYPLNLHLHRSGAVAVAH
jgi:hypothetical protein